MKEGQVFPGSKNRENYAAVPGDDHHSDSDDGSSVDPDPALSTRSFASVSSFFGSEAGCPPLSLPDSEPDIRGHSPATVGFDESDDVPTLSLSPDVRLTDVWTVYEEKISETNVSTDATTPSKHRQPMVVGGFSGVDGTVSSEIVHKESVCISSPTDAHNSNSLPDENEKFDDVLFQDPVGEEKSKPEQTEYSEWIRSEGKDFEENDEISSSRAESANSAVKESVMPVNDNSSRGISCAAFELVDHQSTSTLSDGFQRVTETATVCKQFSAPDDLNIDSIYRSYTMQHELDSALPQMERNFGTNEDQTDSSSAVHQLHPDTNHSYKLSLADTESLKFNDKHHLLAASAGDVKGNIFSQGSEDKYLDAMNIGENDGTDDSNKQENGGEGDDDESMEENLKETYSYLDLISTTRENFNFSHNFDDFEGTSTEQQSRIEIQDNIYQVFVEGDGEVAEIGSSLCNDKETAEKLDNKRKEQNFNGDDLKLMQNQETELDCETYARDRDSTDLVNMDEDMEADEEEPSEQNTSVTTESGNTVGRDENSRASSSNSVSLKSEEIEQKDRISSAVVEDLKTEPTEALSLNVDSEDADLNDSHEAKKISSRGEGSECVLKDNSVIKGVAIQDADEMTNLEAICSADKYDEDIKPEMKSMFDSGRNNISQNMIFSEGEEKMMTDEDFEGKKESKTTVIATTEEVYQTVTKTKDTTDIIEDITDGQIDDKERVKAVVLTSIDEDGQIETVIPENIDFELTGNEETFDFKDEMLSNENGDRSSTTNGAASPKEESADASELTHMQKNISTDAEEFEAENDGKLEEYTVSENFNSSKFRNELMTDDKNVDELVAYDEVRNEIEAECDISDKMTADADAEDEEKAEAEEKMRNGEITFDNKITTDGDSEEEFTMAGKDKEETSVVKDEFALGEKTKSELEMNARIEDDIAMRDIIRDEFTNNSIFRELKLDDGIKDQIAADDITGVELLTMYKETTDDLKIDDKIEDLIKMDELTGEHFETDGKSGELKINNKTINEITVDKTVIAEFTVNDRIRDELKMDEKIKDDIAMGQQSRDEFAADVKDEASKMNDTIKDDIITIDVIIDEFTVDEKIEDHLETDDEIKDEIAADDITTDEFETDCKFMESKMKDQIGNEIASDTIRINEIAADENTAEEQLNTDDRIKDEIEAGLAEGAESAAGNMTEVFRMSDKNRDKIALDNLVMDEVMASVKTEGTLNMDIKTEDEIALDVVIHGEFTVEDKSEDEKVRNGVTLDDAAREFHADYKITDESKMDSESQYKFAIDNVMTDEFAADGWIRVEFDMHDKASSEVTMDHVTENGFAADQRTNELKVHDRINEDDVTEDHSTGDDISKQSETNELKMNCNITCEFAIDDVIINEFTGDGDTIEDAITADGIALCEFATDYEIKDELRINDKARGEITMDDMTNCDFLTDDKATKDEFRMLDKIRDEIKTDCNTRDEFETDESRGQMKDRMKDETKINDAIDELMADDQNKVDSKMSEKIKFEITMDDVARCEFHADVISGEMKINDKMTMDDAVAEYNKITAQLKVNGEQECEIKTNVQLRDTFESDGKSRNINDKIEDEIDDVIIGEVVFDDKTKDDLKMNEKIKDEITIGHHVTRDEFAAADAKDKAWKMNDKIKVDIMVNDVLIDEFLVNENTNENLKTNDGLKDEITFDSVTVDEFAADGKIRDELEIHDRHKSGFSVNDISRDEEEELNDRWEMNDKIKEEMTMSDLTGDAIGKESKTGELKIIDNTRDEIAMSDAILNELTADENMTKDELKMDDEVGDENPVNVVAADDDKVKENLEIIDEGKREITVDEDITRDDLFTDDKAKDEQLNVDGKLEDEMKVASEMTDEFTAGDKIGDELNTDYKIEGEITVDDLTEGKSATAAEELRRDDEIGYLFEKHEVTAHENTGDEKTEDDSKMDAKIGSDTTLDDVEVEDEFTLDDVTGREATADDDDIVYEMEANDKTHDELTFDDEVDDEIATSNDEVAASGDGCCSYETKADDEFLCKVVSDDAVKDKVMTEDTTTHCCDAMLDSDSKAETMTAEARDEILEMLESDDDTIPDDKCRIEEKVSDVEAMSLSVSRDSLDLEIASAESEVERSTNSIITATGAEAEDQRSRVTKADGKEEEKGLNYALRAAIDEPYVSKIGEIFETSQNSDINEQRSENALIGEAGFTSSSRDCKMTENASTALQEIEMRIISERISEKTEEDRSQPRSQEFLEEFEFTDENQEIKQEMFVNIEDSDEAVKAEDAFHLTDDSIVKREKEEETEKGAEKYGETKNEDSSELQLSFVGESEKDEAETSKWTVKQDDQVTGQSNDNSVERLPHSEMSGETKEKTNDEDSRLITEDDISGNTKAELISSDVHTPRETKLFSMQEKDVDRKLEQDDVKTEVTLDAVEDAVSEIDEPCKKSAADTDEETTVAIVCSESKTGELEMIDNTRDEIAMSDAILNELTADEKMTKDELKMDDDVGDENPVNVVAADDDEVKENLEILDKGRCEIAVDEDISRNDLFTADKAKDEQLNVDGKLKDEMKVASEMTDEFTADDKTGDVLNTDYKIEGEITVDDLTAMAEELRRDDEIGYLFEKHEVTTHENTGDEKTEDDFKMDANIGSDTTLDVVVVDEFTLDDVAGREVTADDDIVYETEANDKTRDELTFDHHDVDDEMSTSGDEVAASGDGHCSYETKKADDEFLCKVVSDNSAKDKATNDDTTIHRDTMVDRDSRAEMMTAEARDEILEMFESDYDTVPDDKCRIEEKVNDVEAMSLSGSRDSLDLEIASAESEVERSTNSIITATGAEAEDQQSKVTEADGKEEEKDLKYALNTVINEPYFSKISKIFETSQNTDINEQRDESALFGEAGFTSSNRDCKITENGSTALQEIEMRIISERTMEKTEEDRSQPRSQEFLEEFEFTDKNQEIKQEMFVNMEDRDEAVKAEDVFHPTDDSIVKSEKEEETEKGAEKYEETKNIDSSELQLSFVGENEKDEAETNKWTVKQDDQMPGESNDNSVEKLPHCEMIGETKDKTNDEDSRAIAENDDLSGNTEELVSSDVHTSRKTELFSVQEQDADRKIEHDDVKTDGILDAVEDAVSEIDEPCKKSAKDTDEETTAAIVCGESKTGELKMIDNTRDEIAMSDVILSELTADEMMTKDELKMDDEVGYENPVNVIAADDDEVKEKLEILDKGRREIAVDEDITRNDLFTADKAKDEQLNVHGKLKDEMRVASEMTDEFTADDKIGVESNTDYKIEDEIRVDDLTAGESAKAAEELRSDDQIGYLFEKHEVTIHENTGDEKTEDDSKLDAKIGSDPTLDDVIVDEFTLVGVAGRDVTADDIVYETEANDKTHDELTFDHHEVDVEMSTSVDEVAASGDGRCSYETKKADDEFLCKVVSDNAVKDKVTTEDTTMRRDAMVVSDSTAEIMTAETRHEILEMFESDDDAIPDDKCRIEEKVDDVEVMSLSGSRDTMGSKQTEHSLDLDIVSAESEVEKAFHPTDNSIMKREKEEESEKGADKYEEMKNVDSSELQLSIVGESEKDEAETSKWTVKHDDQMTGESNDNSVERLPHSEMSGETNEKTNDEDSRAITEDDISGNTEEELLSNDVHTSRETELFSMQEKDADRKLKHDDVETDGILHAVGDAVSEIDEPRKKSAADTDEETTAAIVCSGLQDAENESNQSEEVAREEEGSQAFDEDKRTLFSHDDTVAVTYVQSDGAGHLESGGRTSDDGREGGDGVFEWETTRLGTLEDVTFPEAVDETVKASLINASETDFQPEVCPMRQSDDEDSNSNDDVASVTTETQVPVVGVETGASAVPLTNRPAMEYSGKNLKADDSKIVEENAIVQKGSVEVAALCKEREPVTEEDDDDDDDDGGGGGDDDLVEDVLEATDIKDRLPPTAAAVGEVRVDGGIVSVVDTEFCASGLLHYFRCKQESVDDKSFSGLERDAAMAPGSEGFPSVIWSVDGTSVRQYSVCSDVDSEEGPRAREAASVSTSDKDFNCRDIKSNDLPSQFFRNEVKNEILNADDRDLQTNCSRPIDSRRWQLDLCKSSNDREAVTECLQDSLLEKTECAQGKEANRPYHHLLLKYYDLNVTIQENGSLQSDESVKPLCHLSDALQGCSLVEELGLRAGVAAGDDDFSICGSRSDKMASGKLKCIKADDILQLQEAGDLSHLCEDDVLSFGVSDSLKQKDLLFDLNLAERQSLDVGNLNKKQNMSSSSDISADFLARLPASTRQSEDNRGFNHRGRYHHETYDFGEEKENEKLLASVVGVGSLHFSPPAASSEDGRHYSRLSASDSESLRKKKTEIESDLLWRENMMLWKELEQGHVKYKKVLEDHQTKQRLTNRTIRELQQQISKTEKEISERKRKFDQLKFDQEESKTNDERNRRRRCNRLL